MTQWNIIYNDVLNLLVPEKATAASYSVNMALIVVAERLEDAEIYSCKIINAVKVLLEGTVLAHAEKKKEIALIANLNKRKKADH